MGFNDFMAAPGITPGATSYFSAPSADLDPNLFSGKTLLPSIRDGILSILFGYLSKNFNDPYRWTKAWLAGSGVSYQWEASRYPGDLDCLVGIEYVRFRQLNSEYAGYSDSEIAGMFNERFSADIMPNTKEWHGYELTYYVNPATDIRDLNPYAAYDLMTDTWTVNPDHNPTPPYSRDWEQKSQRDHDAAVEMLERYNNALNELRSASNPAYRTNAERKLLLAQDQAATLYDDIHHGRREAFSKSGAGYADFHNYRWQAGKRSGAVQALRRLKEQRDAYLKSQQQELYGIELPNTSTLIRRSMERR